MWRSISLGFLKFLVTAMVILVVLVLAGGMLGSDLDSPLPEVDQEDLAAVTKLRDLSYDKQNPPSTWREVDYGEGPTAAWWPKGEAPVLAGLAAEQKLPPVAERVGSEPVVLEGPDGIGSYGGTWFRLASGAGDTHVMGWRLSGSCLVRWSTMGDPIVPHAAKRFEVNEDGSVYTFHLRKGMRWSDGHPLTTEDVRYWWNEHRRTSYVPEMVEDPKTGKLVPKVDKDGNPVYKKDPGTGEYIRKVNAPPKYMRVGSEVGDIEIVDDYTFRYRFPAPHGLFLQMLASQHGWCVPAHYFKQYHPLDGDKAKIAEACAKYGMDASKPQAFYASNKLTGHLNPHHPRIWPWILRKESANPPYIWVRNPYYWAVDPAGNQLPYLDQVHFEVKANKFIATAASHGEVTMQRRHISVDDYTLLMAGRQEGKYSLYHWYPATRSTFTIFPNINRHIDEGDQHSYWKHHFLNKKEFRQALSLAIDRQAIITAFGWGTEPAQIDPGRDSVWHSPELYKAFTDYDPTKAIALLEAAGLNQFDSDGYRCAPDGTRLAFYLNTCSEWTGEGPSLFLIRYWEEIGLRVILRDRARALFTMEKRAFKQDLAVWTGESEFMPLMNPRNFVPTYIESFFAPRFGIWFEKGGLGGDADTQQQALAAGGLEPPADHPLRQNMEDYNAILCTGDLAEQKRLWQQITKRCADHLWTISIATHPPQPVVVKHGFANVPKTALDGAGFYTPGNAAMDTYFWDHAALERHDIDPTSVGAVLSEGAMEDLRVQMLSISDRYETTTLGFSDGEGGSVEAKANWSVAGIIIILFWGSLLVLILMMALRHPFVMRRLLIMVPTLLIISVVGFIVIQAPPGDLLETRIAELSMKGDEPALQQAIQLKEQFRVERSKVDQYCWWMGFNWFFTFEDADRGLLQGNLGLSMEDGESVNDKVGDRIVLTMLIALFSILLTWAIALFTGTYSAVNQYTKGDYILTFISFIGMSVPGFLLALIFVFLAYAAFGVSITGLFSTEYAAQPEWTWGKVWDLLKHIWVPVLVAGIGGTAGLFRVMRGNLLDELKKPYVTTARAKGVRPVKLLVKYPLRVALNPVISTIGGIFPELISGSAIIAIVLSLPTVGPMMLTALLTEDMYLAGSMLMVLSLLGIFGTLVSDLLLLWLDPRIRMEGGKTR